MNGAAASSARGRAGLLSGMPEPEVTREDRIAADEPQPGGEPGNSERLRDEQRRGSEAFHHCREYREAYFVD